MLNMIKAHKVKYNFTTHAKQHNRYNDLIRDFVYKMKPTMFSIFNKKEVETPDGPMLLLELITSIDDPHKELIAKCRFNSLEVYVYKDLIYLNAVSTNGELISIRNPENDSLVVVIHELKDESELD